MPVLTSTGQSISHGFGSRYQLLEPLGAGGMGTVYVAQDRLTGRRVALKCVLSSPLQPASPEWRLALTREFQALASLRHPHVIAVEDYGFDQARQPYFSMELLPAARPFTVATPLPLHTKVDLLLQLLQALIYVHRRGIIHRDLKPGNVLLHGSQVKLVDFGLAAVRGQAFAPSGTLTYMAPEVLLGDPATTASDLYAVGVLAYELLAGWHPFAHVHAARDAILSAEPDFAYVEIPPALVEVLQRLLAKDPATRYADAAATMSALCRACDRALPLETEATRDSFLQAAPFVGREDELKRLVDALHAAVDGNGSAWIVRGESGIGKSRLLQELRTQALVQGVFVLRSLGRADGGAYHLWPDLLRPLLFHTPPDDLEAAVLRPILPDIEQWLGRPVPMAPPLTGKASRVRLRLTIAGLLQRAAQTQPLLLLLEDLHWADAASLDLLEALPGTAQILLVGSSRVDEQPNLPPALSHFQLLPLTRLAAPQVADLCAAVLGEQGRQSHLVDFVRQQSEGNTFFIVEVMRTLAEETGRLDTIAAMTLPVSVFAGGMQRMVQRRLQRIAPIYQPLLHSAAVAGRQVDLTLLAHLFPQADLDEWLTRCANAAVLEPTPGSRHWEFSHDKLREELLRQIDVDTRPQLHRRVARGIESVYAANLGPYFADLAFHFGQAGDVPIQRRYLKQAGQQAEQNYAGEMAVAYYSQQADISVDPTDKVDALLCLANVRQFLGQFDQAEADVQSALALLAGTQAQTLYAYAYFLLGRIWRSRGHWTDAIVWLRQAEAAYTALDATEGLCDTLSEIGVCHYSQGEYAEATTILTRSLQLAYRLEDTRRVASVMHNLGNISFDQGDYALTRQRYMECLELSREIGDRAKEASTLNNLGILADYQGDVMSTRRYYEEALAIRRQIGDRSGVGASLNNLGILARDAADYAAALSLYAQALQIARELGDKQAMAYPLKNMGVVLEDQGDYAQAQRYYEESLAVRREIKEKWGIASVLTSLGYVLNMQQEYAQALRYYREGLQVSCEIGDARLYVGHLCGIAAALAHPHLGNPVYLQRAAHLIGFVYRWIAETGITSTHQEEADTLAVTLRKQMGEDGYAAAVQQGAKMSLDAAVAEALREENNL